MHHHLRPLAVRTASLVLAATVASLLYADASSARTETFSNHTPIVDPPGGGTGPAPWSLYPSDIYVTGMSGAITDVDVLVHGFDHRSPTTAQLLLVSPQGDHVPLMAGRCGGDEILNRTWMFDASARTFIGNTTGCNEFHVRPTSQFGAETAFPAPAPEGPHQLRLGDFDGDPANGVWRLYASSRYAGHAGQLRRGWSVRITTEDPAIALLGPGPGTPSPARRTVSGRTGLVDALRVSVGAVTHPRPDDLDLLLVGPGGQAVILLSDACGATPLARWNLTFEDGRDPAPDSERCTGTTTYRPSAYDPASDAWGAAAPAGPYADTLAAFHGTDPNGEWRLFASDDGVGADGWISTPFDLVMRVRDRAPVAFARPAITVGEGERASLTLTRSPANGLGAGTVRVTTAAGSATAGADFTPLTTTVAFAAGERTKEVTVRALPDDAREDEETFTVAIADPAGDASAGRPATTTVTVRDTTPGGGDDDADAGGGDGPGGGGGPSGEDRSAPVLRALSIAPRRIARRRPATIRWTLSEPARVELRVARRDDVVATLRRAGRPGANALRWRGRAGGRVLRPGRYRVAVTAVDAAGNRSATWTRRVRIG